MVNGPFGSLNADLTSATITPTGGASSNMADIAAAANAAQTVLATGPATVGANTTQSISVVAGLAAKNTFNASASLLPNSRRKLASSLTGSSRFRIAYVGDSTTMGVSSSTLTFAQTKSSVFAGRLNALGIPTRTDNALTVQQLIYKTGGNCANDSRLTFGAGAAVATALQASVAYTLVSLTSSTGTITFAPTGTVTSFDIWYYGASAGTFSWQIDGGSATTITVPFNGVMNKTTVTAAAGVHTLTLTWLSGSILIGMIEAYNTAVNDVTVMNMGISGIASPAAIALPGTNFGQLGMWVDMAADLYILNLGINDSYDDLALSVSQANIQTLITNLQSVGADVILEVPEMCSTSSGWLSPSNGGVARQQALGAMLYGLSASNNVPLLDISGRLGQFAVANALGFMGSDGIHPSVTGYSDIGRFEFSAFRDMVAL